MSVGGGPRRQPSLVGLTHLRALAIALVFVYHYQLFGHPAWVERVGAFGWTGVDLFFVLSGFLISRQLFHSIATTGSFSLQDFYFRRALRILPAYLVVVACYFSFPWMHEREALPALWKFLTFTQNLGLDLRSSGTFSHAWSLCIEEQFYLVLPLCLLALLAIRAGRRAAWLLPLVFFAGVLARALVYLMHVAPLRADASFEVVWYEWIYYPTWSRLDALLDGIAIAALHELRPDLRRTMTGFGNSPLALGIVLWIATWCLFVDPQSLTASVAAFPAIAIVYGLFAVAALSPACFLALHGVARHALVRALSHTQGLHPRDAASTSEGGLGRERQRDVRLLRRHVARGRAPAAPGGRETVLAVARSRTCTPLS